MFPGFEYSDILQVTVSGLAVRKAPVLGSGMVRGYLNSDDFVSVHLGPLPIGDAVWYLVWPAEGARLHYGTFRWVTTGPSEPGWVAASVGDEQYLRLHRRPETSEIEEYLPAGLTVSGTGDYQSAPQPRHDLFIFNWAVAPGDQPSPCTFSVTLLPQDGIEPVVVVDTSTADVQEGPISGAGAIPNTPWGPSAGGSWDSFTMLIASDCTWTVGLHALHHD